MKNKVKQRLPLYFISIILAAICLFAALSSAYDFNHKLNQYLNQNVVKNLQEANENSINLIKDKMDRQIKILAAVSSQVEQEDDIKGQDSIDILNSAIELTQFSKIVVADPTGASVDNKGQILDVSNQEAFKQSLKGKIVVSQPQTSTLDSRPTMLLSLPIKQNRNIIGVVLGSLDINLLQQSLRSNTFGGQGYSIIVDSEGGIITGNAPNASTPESENILVSLKSVDFANGYSLEQLKTDLTHGVGNNIEYSYQSQTGRNQERMAYYAAIDYNDWFLLTVVPKSVVTAQSDQIINNTTLLFGHISLIFAGIVLFIIYLTRRNRAEMLKVYADQETIQRTIPGGVQKCLKDEYYTIQYINEGFTELTGYNQKELAEKFNNHYIELILPQDRAKIAQEIAEKSKQNNIFCLEYRITHKDGRILWVFDKVQLALDDLGNPIYICVLLDVTADKEEQERLRISEERMRIIFNQSDEIIFDYDIPNKIINFSENFKTIFHHDPQMLRNPEEVIKSGIVHPDDIQSYKRFALNIRTGLEFDQIEIKVLLPGDFYAWYRISYTNMFNEDGQPIMAVGKMTNIDRQKRENEELKAQAFLDPLTKIYNKTVSRSIIEDFLEGPGSRGIHAFIIIDVDNFKGVNDNWGHAFGDAVLTDLTSKIKEVFRSSDIIGRVGGDEFLVFLKNIPNVDFVRRKASNLCEIFRQTKLGNGEQYPISASIGIALYNIHGANFDQLYIHADSALYLTKHKGKDGYCVYNAKGSDN